MAAAGEPKPKRLKSSNDTPGAPGAPECEAFSRSTIDYEKSAADIGSLAPSAPPISVLYPHIYSHKTFDVFFKKKKILV